MVLLKLAGSNFRVHKIRFALTVAAIALAVSLVVSVTSGYASAEGAANKFFDKFVGSIDAIIARQNDTRGAMPESLVTDLEADSDVDKVTERLETELPLVDPSTFLLGRVAQVSGIRRPADTRVERLQMVEGAWFEAETGDVAVIDQEAAKVLAVKLGDSFMLPKGDRRLRLKVVAIVHKPGFIASQVQTIYVPLRTLQNFLLPENPHQVNRIMVALKKGVDPVKFGERWRAKLTTIDPLLQMKLTHEHREEMQKNLATLRIVSYMGGTISMLAAAFIIFSSLSMGVTERQRTLAMLRAIGMERGGVGKLVIAEGLVLAGAGILVGVPLGLLWVKILVAIPRFHDVLAAGMVISWGGVIYGAFGALTAALLASLLPAWNATRVSPLEAMTPLASVPKHAVPIRPALIGLVLITIDSYLMHGPGLSRVARFYGHFALGVPCLLIGFFLLSPMFVWTIERLAGPIVAPLMGIRFALLRQQLSAGIWRAAGTCAALMVGLAILVVMQTQGTTMLNGWKLPTHFPDIFIAAPPLSPLDEAAVDKLRSVEGIKGNELMPIAIASPELGSGIFALAGIQVMPDATLFFGIDPDKAFKLMELDFRDGNAGQARELLKKGRHLVVGEEFHELKGWKVGDKIKLNTPRHGMVEYTIAGVVWSPGIDVIVSMQDLGRQFDKRTAGSVFGTLADAKEDFGVDQVYLLCGNLDYFVERKDVLKRVQAAVGRMGMQAYDVRQIKHAITEAFRSLLLLVSSVGFSAMAVASLGVTNTIMASVRSRRWQFGVLRSIGVTRGQLLRLVLAEALLLGVVGCALGLAAGGLMSVNARGFSRITIGYSPPLSVPWGMIWIGVGAVMLIALLASLWPAFHVARREPLELLQAGRASA